MGELSRMGTRMMTLPQKCPITKPKRKRSKRTDLEGHVVRECLKFLNDCPGVIYVERRNTGAVQFEGGGFIRFGSKGAADIWCLVKETLYEVDVSGDPLDIVAQSRISDSYLVRHVEIECKRADGKGRQSPDQRAFQEFCDSQHIPYILTTSAEKLKLKINAIILDE